MHPDVEHVETLSAPFRFDVSIGYWTGEADLDVLAAALAAVEDDPEVERSVYENGVRLRGPGAAVREQARRLRALGLT